MLPNNGNVIMSAEQAVALAEEGGDRAHDGRSRPGLSALLAFDPGAAAEENAEAMREAIGSVATRR